MVKNNFNTATVPSYFYDGTVDYCICFLICFIISLSSMSDFSTLYLSSFHIPLSLWIALSTLTLSLCAGGWASTLVCGSWVNGSVDCSQLSLPSWRWWRQQQMEMDINGWVLLSWVVFGHGFATMGWFWSWVCYRGCVWFMVLPSLVGFVMGLLQWVSFGHGSAAVDRLCSWIYHHW